MRLGNEARCLVGSISHSSCKPRPKLHISCSLQLELESFHQSSRQLLHEALRPKHFFHLKDLWHPKSMLGWS